MAVNWRPEPGLVARLPAGLREEIAEALTFAPTAAALVGGRLAAVCALAARLGFEPVDRLAVFAPPGQGEPERSFERSRRTIVVRRRSDGE